ncbi:MAG: glycosyltransferase family 1 protein [Verrucomicrobiota bacterium]
MKIGLTTSVIQRGQTGIAQYVLALTRAFERHARRHQFTLFVLEDDFPLFDFARDIMQIVPVPERFRAPMDDIIWHQTQLPGLARKLQLDVLHIPSYRRMIWSRPCALVATIHDLAPFRVAGKYDWKRMLYGRVIARILARRQDEIIAVSETTARDIATFFRLPYKHMSVVYNGVDHTRFNPGSREEAKAAVAARHGIRDPFFLYVARLEHPAKNHVRLITAFNQFKVDTQSPWQLVLAGGDWHGAEEIHAKIKESPFSSEIHCVGFVAEPDLPMLYRAADIFVYPSLYEGFGLPPLEAMACGCPVISSARGALGEVVGDAAAIVDPENIATIRWQMTRLAKDADLREKWIAVGLTRIDRFHWQRAASATLNVYQRAIAKRRGIPAGVAIEDELSR